jgi:heme/copper-type cytochrome/quinol oxidase subunit 2
VGRGSAPAAVWVAFAGLAVAALVLPAPAGAEPQERTIRIEASSFAFDPAVVDVNRGDLVTLELVARDVVHGLYLDGYGVQLRAEPGQTARTTFTADRGGAFRIRCSVTCGPLHPFMIGKFAVGANFPFWRGAALAALVAALGLRVARR